MAHDDQFTAVGPSLTGSGFPRTAFSTKSRNMEYGVNVAGLKCGIYGECDVPADSNRASPWGGIGVYGYGGNYGVLGITPGSDPGIAGVFGLHTNGGAGIIGAAVRGGIGITGASVTVGNPLGARFQPIADPADGHGIGVFGTSGTGAGVRGSSHDGNGGEFASVGGVGASGESNNGPGVRGRGGLGVEGIGRDVGVAGHGAQGFDVVIGVNGKGTVGVQGEAPLEGGGTGVIGHGERGGVFRSSLAQIRLIPLDIPTPIGNISGEPGDLVST